jgi:hypothetical protein
MRFRFALALLLGLAAAALPAATGVALAMPGKPVGIGSNFLPLPEISTPIVGESRVEGVLAVTLVLETKDQPTALALKNRMPELRADALAATIEFSRLYASGYLPVDAARLSKSLNAALKPRYPGVLRVLIVKVGAEPA